LLAEHGVDPHRFFAEQGVEPSLFENPNNLIPYATSTRLYKAAAEATGCESLPVSVGFSAGLDELGPLGAEMRAAATVLDALKAAENAFHLQVSGAKFSVVAEGELAEIHYTVIDPDVLSGGHLICGALAYVCSIMVEMCGSACFPLSADLPLRAPPDKALFKKVFGPRIKFNSPQAVVRFDLRWLGRTPNLKRERSSIPGAFPVHSDTVESTQAACLRESLEGRVATSAHIARKMGCSKRTLSRRLSEKGTSFEHLRKEAIVSTAIRLLNDTDLSITEIGLALGYSEVAAFSRAFHSWTGRPPTHFRPAVYVTPRMNNGRRNLVQGPQI
jgi:AraC-like DNA-binding protein